MKQYKLDIIPFTNQGLRKSNDDRYYHSQIDENTYVFLLADGMGGYADGHLAAEIAIEEVSNYIKNGPELHLEQRIKIAFSNAHRAIKEQLYNAGATVGGILITGDSIFIFWVGDIKITLINGTNVFSSKEHSLLNVLRDAQITIKPEEINRLTHTVVRSVGGDSKSYFPDIFKMNKARTFKGILSSDGILQFFTEDDLLRLLQEKDFSHLNRTFDPSMFNGSKDNVTGLIFFGK